jgi:hypothetical protein
MDGEKFGKDYPGTCLSCGLLGFISSKPNNPGVHELSADHRWYGSKLSAKARLWCFRRMANIQQEVAEAESMILGSAEPFVPESSEDSERGRAMREVFCRPRPKCVEQGAWRQYVDFLDPKWHYEDWRMLDLEESRRKQDEKIAKAEQRWQATSLQITESHKEVAEATRQIAGDHEALAARNDTQTKRFNVLFAIFGGFTLMLAFIQVCQVATDDDSLQITLPLTSATIEPTASATLVPQPTPDRALSPNQSMQ